MLSVWCFGVSFVYSFALLYSCCLVYHSHHHHARDAHGAYASSLIMVSCVRNLSREARGGGGTIATMDGHKPPTPLFPFFGPPTRPTTQTPHNTQQSRGGQDRGTPGQMKAGARAARHQARAHFAWVLRSSRQVGAGSRGRVTPTAVQRHIRIR